jgi:hypothetical protein
MAGRSPVWMPLVDEPRAGSSTTSSPPWQHIRDLKDLRAGQVPRQIEGEQE